MNQNHQRRELVLAACAASLGTWLLATEARAVVITFDDLPDDTFVTAQYGAVGALFLSSPIFAVDTAPSPPNALISSDLNLEFDPGPLTIRFRSPQQQVSMAASCFFPFATVGTLTAFDEQGAVVAQDGPRSVDCGDFSTAFAVSTPASVIWRIELQMSNSQFELIDDLSFVGEPPPPPVASRPVVEITAPPPGPVDIATSTTTVSGTIRGPLLLFATLRVLEAPVPGVVGRPPFVTTLELMPTGAPDTFTFTQPIGPFFPLGRTEIVVEAVNEAGMTGTDQVVVTNVLPSIASACGPGQRLGPLLYGIALDGCVVAACALGGVAATEDDQPLFDMPLPILNKALAVQDPRLGGPGTVGCPTAAAEGVASGGQRQQFQRARLYDLPGRVVYVPNVFANAIDVLGGDASTGLPVADPPGETSGSVPTLYFQRYARPALGADLDSTLEIRGQVPVLSVQRVGGNSTELALAELTVQPSTATIWQRYPCQRNGRSFTCTVVSDSGGPPVEDANQRFCGGFTFPLATTRQWVPVIHDDQNTSIQGWIRARSPDVSGATGSHMAWADNPLVHEHHGGPPRWWSDWNLHIVPLVPYEGLLGGNFRSRNFEIEIEQYFVNYFFVAVGIPRAGDLVYSNGRWIVDCGHASGNTEIHPPSVIVSMRTGELFSGRVTEAEVYAGGFYNGEDVAFDLFPPPRPRPDATLIVTKPPGSTGGFGMELDYEFRGDHIRARFSAPRQVNPVTAFGEQKFVNGRGYLATWTVGWSAAPAVGTPP